MKGANRKVVVIDDDPANNTVFKIILNSMCRPMVPDITDFTLPEEGLSYLTRTLMEDNDERIVLFLDINMPVLMGWDVLDRLHRLPGFAKERLTVFMLSSSVDPADKKRAGQHPLVERFLEKPVTLSMLWIKEWLMGEAPLQVS